MSGKKQPSAEEGGELKRIVGTNFRGQKTSNVDSVLRKGGGKAPEKPVAGSLCFESGFTVGVGEGSFPQKLPDIVPGL